MNRLRAYRETRETNLVPNDIYTNVTDYWDFGESETQEYKVIKPPENALCENIACVTSDNLPDVACLDLGKIDLLPGSLLGNVRVKPLEKIGKVFMIDLTIIAIVLIMNASF